ncbi:MAG: stage II sporulation protein M [Candidatus Methanomethylicia archaeon]
MSSNPSFKKCIIASTLIFMVGVFLGLITILPEPVGEEFINPLKEMAKMYNPFNPITVMLIFAKNALAVMIMWISGFLLAIPTIISLWLNGYIIGFVIKLSGNPIQALIGILPHGIIEIPAVLIAGAAGIRVGLTIIGKASSIFTHKKVSLTRVILETFRAMQLSIILLIPAAIIETYITPIMIMWIK